MGEKKRRLLEQKLDRILYILGALPDSGDYQKAKNRFEKGDYQI